MENKWYFIKEVGNLGGNDQDEWNLFHSYVLMKKVCILKRSENTEKENNYYINAIKKYGGNPILIDDSNINRLDECCGILITGR